MKRLTLAMVLLTLSGCQNNPWAPGRWASQQFGQGSIERQKNRAVMTDPFPQNDIGPEVVGGRPREFANPLPEATRNHLQSEVNARTNTFGSGRR